MNGSPNSEEIRAKLTTHLETLRQRDRQAKVVSKEVSPEVSSSLREFESCLTSNSSSRGETNFSGKALKILWEDEFLVVVDKPAGVLSVASEEGVPCLAQTVFECINNNFVSYDRMVIHRLGTDTSGLIVFAKTMEALRGMNTLFRTRQVIRQYEVLVCGLVKNDEGMIDMPLMRDYMFPPYMRISTDIHQRALVGLDASIVGKKLLEAPKPSQTQYAVKSRETLGNTDLPVTRLTVTSITGRTHQLNVHCAAFGHPIVGDNVYGVNGEAAPYGGLQLMTSRDDVPDISLQKAIAEAAKDMSMCVHATYLQFRHPVTGELLEFRSPAPF